MKGKTRGKKTKRQFSDPNASRGNEEEGRKTREIEDDDDEKRRGRGEEKEM